MEHVGELCVVEHALGPAGTGAEDVAVGEATAGDEAGEVLEVDAAGEEVGHVDVDGVEAGAAEGECHFVLAVDALFAEDGHFRGADVFRSLGRWGSLEVEKFSTSSEVEGGFDEDAVVFFEEGVVFFFGAGWVVAFGLHVVGEFGPSAVEGGDGFAE